MAAPRTALRASFGDAADRELAYHDIGPRQEAPRVALVAGVHGDELNGVFVLARLASFLQRVAAGTDERAHLLGRVLIVPAVNAHGLAVDDAGESPQRLAAAALELTAQARWRIELRAADADFEDLPQVRLSDASDEQREAARWFGLPAVIERCTSQTFGTALASRGGSALALQAGHAGSLQARHCERLFRALIEFLERAGVLLGVRLAEAEEDVHFFGPQHSFPLLSEQAGWFVSRLEVGQWLRAGELLGYVYDGFSGEQRAELHAPVSGLLAGLRRHPLLGAGDLVARILTRHDARGH